MSLHNICKQYMEYMCAIVSVYTWAWTWVYTSNSTWFIVYSTKTNCVSQVIGLSMKIIIIIIDMEIILNLLHAYETGQYFKMASLSRDIATFSLENVQKFISHCQNYWNYFVLLRTLLNVSWSTRERPTSTSIQIYQNRADQCISGSDDATDTIHFIRHMLNKCSMCNVCMCTVHTCNDRKQNLSMLYV